MARSKSTSGGKTNRPNQEQTSTGYPANLPDVKAATAETASAATVPQTEIRSETRKFEVRKPEPRKPEPRKNVVPINLEDEIRRRAYELYQQRGSAFGSEAEDWVTAEREVLQRYHQQSA
jgi:hypothetical protein